MYSPPPVRMVPQAPWSFHEYLVQPTCHAVWLTCCAMQLKCHAMWPTHRPVWQIQQPLQLSLHFIIGKGFSAFIRAKKHFFKMCSKMVYYPKKIFSSLSSGGSPFFEAFPYLTLQLTNENKSIIKRCCGWRFRHSVSQNT